MLTTLEKTVREIALENPASIRVFELLGIDYCCGGKRPLSEACSRVGIDLNRVHDLLDEAARDSQVFVLSDWNGKLLSELIDHIVETHHGFVRRETPRIASLLDKVIAKHGAANILQIQQLFTAISQELATHMAKEEQLLFPYIKQMEQSALHHDSLTPSFFGSVQRPIANMVADHDDAGALLAQIRELAGDFNTPTGACPTFAGLYRGLEDFERDLHHHVHLENNVLFPRAIAMEQAH